MSGSSTTTAEFCQTLASASHLIRHRSVPESQSSTSITENETEVSFFNRELYDAFKLDPKVHHLASERRRTDTNNRKDQLGLRTCVDYGDGICL